ncbi:uncharacterized protein LOC134820427 isoform X2 [Bolinopsis microptera]|uniref:uncharacterized protein LOC134820427 isoform X2 n=1 Tax=Bolinopsis microptera TaxID=2820187 RepID=UPI0030799E7D
MGVGASCDSGNSEKEFLLMQAKDLSHELRHTRTVCDTLKDELSDKKARCERAESDKKQLKFAVKQLNGKLHEYEIMIARLQHAVKNNEIYDMYDENFSSHRSNTPCSARRSYTSMDSGVHDTAVSPMNDIAIQTIEDTKASAVQCSMLNVSHLQSIMGEIDAQIVSVDEIITQNKTSLSVLDSLFESEAEVVEEDDSSSEKDSSSDDEMAAMKTAAVIDAVLVS